MLSKIALVLSALGLEYEPIYLSFDEIKGPEHMKHNPNGRIPTLIDHGNNDFTIWYDNLNLLNMNGQEMLTSSRLVTI